VRTAFVLASATLSAALLIAREGCTPAGGVAAHTRVATTPAPTTEPAVLTAALLPALGTAAGTARRQRRDGTGRSDAEAAANAAHRTRAARLPPDNPQRIAALLAARPERPTLALLSRIERELKRDPPAELHALITAQRRGARRAELLERVRRDLPQDLLLRALVVRWINEVAPDPHAKATATPAAALSGAGGGRWLAPIQRL